MRADFECRRVSSIRCVVGAALAIASFTLIISAADAPVAFTPPKVFLKLNLNEFSILNVSEMDGLLKYGGSGDFKLRMAREGTNGVFWNVIVDDPRLVELLSIFIGEKTVKLVQSLDPGNIDPNQKLALLAIKSLSEKLEEARKHPVWESVDLSGHLTRDNGVLRVVSSRGVFVVVGEKLGALEKLEGKHVVLKGFVKAKNQMEVVSFLEKRMNTLELFVMSYCPFGQRAQNSLVQWLESTNAFTKPNVEIRYIFYRRKVDERETFAALHGEEEIIENLVQIVLRDSFPKFFRPYLLRRALGGRVSWKVLVEQIGMPAHDISDISQALASRRDDIIQKEYEYVAGRYGIEDGSPSYAWESERVADLTKIPEFKGIDGNFDETCSQ